MEALLKGNWNVGAPVFVPNTTGVSTYNDNLPHDDSGYDGDNDNKYEDNDNKGTMGERVVVPRPPPPDVEVEATPSLESESTEHQAPQISGRAAAFRFAADQAIASAPIGIAVDADAVAKAAEPFPKMAGETEPASASQDRQGPSPYRTGMTVQLHGLNTKPILNGKWGTLGKFNPAKGRWEVTNIHNPHNIPGQGIELADCLIKEENMRIMC